MLYTSFGSLLCESAKIEEIKIKLDINIDFDKITPHTEPVNTIESTANNEVCNATTVEQPTNPWMSCSIGFQYI